MRDLKNDHQMSLPLKISEESNASSPHLPIKESSVIDLSIVRSSMHANAVVDRVVREGYIRKK